MSSPAASSTSTNAYADIPLSPRQRRASLAAVIVSTFFLGVSLGVGYPLTSITFERWGTPAFVTGLAAGMPALAALVILPFAPRLAARLGFLPAMVGGAFIGVAGFLLLPIFQSVEAWIALRFLMGVGLVFPWLLGETWINTVTTDETRGRVLSLYAAALFGGYGAGPLALGALPEGLAWPVAIGAASLVLVSVPLLIARRLAPPMAGHGQASFAAALRIAPIGMVGALLAGVLEFAYIALLPTFALRSGVEQSGSLHLLTAFLWGGVFLAPAFGWLVDRVQRPRLLLGLVLGFAALAAPAAWLVGHPLGLAATLLLGGVALAFYTLGLAILGERARPVDLAPANAAFLVVYQLGTLGGPPIVGAAMDSWPPTGFVAATIAYALLSAILIIALMAVEGRRSRV